MKDPSHDPDPIIVTDSSFYEKYFSISLNQGKCTEYFLKTGNVVPGTEMIIDLTDKLKFMKLINENKPPEEILEILLADEDTQI